jgi:hypothetical protein
MSVWKLVVAMTVCAAVYLIANLICCYCMLYTVITGESCIFIFVTRAYDVGDTVHFKDDMGADTVFTVQVYTLYFRSLYPTYCIV